MRRLALMIAINQYPNLKPQFNLKGCLNDQQLLQGLLMERFGFQEEDITTLTDTQATRANILAELDRLAGMGNFAGASSVGEGDFVLIAYSGHGARLKEPPDQRDEADGYDSTIVPCDSDRPVPTGKGGKNLDITDDELFARLQRIKERASHVALYFDCCHSGTISRDLDGSLARNLPDDDRHGDVVRVNPFADTGSRAAMGEAPPKGRSGWLPLDAGYVLIAGCGDDEKAREYRDPESQESYGALTYHIVREMQRATGSLTYHDVFRPAQAAVNALFSTQHPQIEGDWNRALFGLEQVMVEPFVAVQGRVGERGVTLAAGAAHGVTVGSRWEILPPNLADTVPLATVTIRAVGPLSSDAESEDALPPAVAAQCRAIEVEHLLGEARVAVAVDGKASHAMNQLRDLVQGSSMLTLAKEGPVEMVAVLLPPRTAAEAVPTTSSDGSALPVYAPELGELSVATWAIVGRDRSLLPSPTHPADEPGAIQDTLDNLETWARYRNIHRLQPVGVDPLRDKVRLRLSRVAPSGALEELPLHPASGLPLVHDGETIRMELENTHSAPLFCALLSLNAIGRIEQIWPGAATIAPITPGTSLPLEAPFTVSEKLLAALEGGKETLKIMVTPKFADFYTLTQPGGKLVPGSEGSSEVTDLFGAAMAGSRDINTVKALNQSITDESWGVVQVDYYMARSQGQ